MDRNEVKSKLSNPYNGYGIQPGFDDQGQKVTPPTLETETSQYQEERKSTETSLVVASERGQAISIRSPPPQPGQSRSSRSDTNNGLEQLAIDGDSPVMALCSPTRALQPVYSDKGRRRPWQSTQAVSGRIGGLPSCFYSTLPYRYFIAVMRFRKGEPSSRLSMLH